MNNVRRITRSSHISSLAFAREAERLLADARAAVSNDEAVIRAYRAGLRAAGAIIQESRKKRRRLPNGSAWLKLRTVAPELEEWARKFEKHARLSSRAELGLEGHMERSVYEEVYRDACDLVDVARSKVGDLQRAA